MNGVPHPYDTVFFKNNYRSHLRGNLTNYMPKDHDGKTSYFFESNYIRKMNHGSIEEVYNNPNRSSVHVLGLEVSPGANHYIVAQNNTYDYSITSFSRNSKPVMSNNQQDTLPAVKFRNFLGQSNHKTFTNNYDYTRFERYTNIIGTSNAFIPSDNSIPGGTSRKGEAAWWSVGDVVQYWNSDGKTRFYLCIKADSSRADYHPSQDDDNPDNAHWVQLHWTKPDGSLSYYPPDDVRLVPGSYYEVKGLGLKE
ncbi:MAG: hypothetical protein U5L96_10865 [Owenweeksia sp.]|nr:hypothetical protein [Owenweeksia sp.]